jgi:hypothetical protein
LTAKLKELVAAGEISSTTAPSDAKRMAAIKLVCDKFLGCLMLSGANRDRFAALKADIHNQYEYGKDLYPKSPDQCLTLLNQCSDAPTWSPHPKDPKPAPIKQEEEALVFTQGTSDKTSAPKQKDEGSKASSLVSSSTSKPQVTNVRCRTCGKLSHTSSVCPDSKPPAQIYAMLVGGPAQVFPPIIFFRAGDLLFPKCKKHPQNRQTPNKERPFFHHDENRSPPSSQFSD